VFACFGFVSCCCFLTFGVLAEGLTKFAYYFGCGCGFIVGGD